MTKSLFQPNEMGSMFATPFLEIFWWPKVCGIQIHWGKNKMEVKKLWGPYFLKEVNEQSPLLRLSIAKPTVSEASRP